MLDPVGQLTPVSLFVVGGVGSDQLPPPASKSLVVATPSNDQTRFSMLETIREYALEKLTERGELASMRRKQAEAFLALAQEARPHLDERGQRRWFARLGSEHANMRTALTWCSANWSARA